jgi:hypothetical protein
LLLLAGAALVASGCSSPSARYGLAPPAKDRESFPNINAPVGVPQQPPLSQEQQAAEKARVAQGAAR